MLTTIVWHLPIKIANEANSSEHWTKKSKRHKIQKRRIKQQFLIDKPPICPPCKCIITRIAPKALDSHDNLRYSLKWAVDSIAENLTGDFVPGRADGNAEITWEYKQEKGKIKEYGLRIQLIKDES